MERNLSFKQIQERIKEYSPELLLSNGRELTKEEDYIRAVVVFKKLLENEKMKDIAKVYLSIIGPEIYIQYKDKVKLISDEKIITSIEIERRLESSSIESLIDGMITATEMHQEGKLSKEDLFTLEKTIDRFPFKTIIIPGRVEFEKLYSRFKEYTLKTFLESKEK